MQLFYKFLSCEKPSKFHHEDIERVIHTVSIWSPSFNQKVAMRRVEKQLEDQENLISPDEIKKFDNSDVVKIGQRIIKKLRTSKEIIPKEFCTSRGYIIV